MSWCDFHYRKSSWPCAAGAFLMSILSVCLGPGLFGILTLNCDQVGELLSSLLVVISLHTPLLGDDLALPAFRARTDGCLYVFYVCKVALATFFKGTVPMFHEHSFAINGGHVFLSLCYNWKNEHQAWLCLAAWCQPTVPSLHFANPVARNTLWKTYCVKR